MTMTIALLVGGCPDRAMKPVVAPPVTAVPDLTGPPDCGAFDAASLAKCVSRQRVEDDTRLIAASRAPGSDHHDKVRRKCRRRLTELGYETEAQDYGSGTNIIGRKPGFSKPGEVVVVGAHYDQRAGCEGADDNASGVAAVLELARVLSTGRFDRSLVIACWDEGEGGQIGSAAHAARAKNAGMDIELAVSLEAIAYARDEPDSQQVPDGFEQLFPDQSLALLNNDHRANFLIVVAETTTESAAMRVVHHGAANELDVHVLTLTERMKVKQRKLHRSDHVSFWDRGFPAMLVTDSGPFRNPRIGCARGADTAASLDFEFASQATSAALGAIAEALEPR